MIVESFYFCHVFSMFSICTLNCKLLRVETTPLYLGKRTGRKGCVFQSMYSINACNVSSRRVEPIHVFCFPRRVYRLHYTCFLDACRLHALHIRVL